MNATQIETTLFNLENYQLLFFYTNVPVKKINVEKNLKLGENYYFIFNFNHFQKSKNFRVLCWEP